MISSEYFDYFPDQSYLRTSVLHGTVNNLRTLPLSSASIGLEVSKSRDNQSHQDQELYRECEP